ncbi:L,D-transpeptidase family protein [Bifidobacterium gallicum]|nr:L,D-transpeptidase family protein [Bifidobacterium gallicum]KFI58643.1 ErfK/YbiS/YcfS/YnhG protein [Bifidobacterium gallicum DSM 20093 = LMG 11596]
MSVVPQPDPMANAQVSQRKKRHIWPWIVGVIVVLAACVTGIVLFFQSHVLPGVSLWGQDMTGKSRAQVVQFVEDCAANTAVSVSYNGTEQRITLADIGMQTDPQALADATMSAKRDGNVFTKYMPWSQDAVDGGLDATKADATKLNAKFNQQVNDPKDATVTLNEEGTSFVTSPAVNSQGLAVKPVADQLVAAVNGTDTHARAVQATVETIEPAITDVKAQQAADTLNGYITNPITFTMNDETIAKLDPAGLAKVSSVDVSETTGEHQVRKGNVLFDVQAIKDYFTNDIQPTLSSTKEDRVVLTGNDGEVIKVISEGHDGVTLADNAADAILTQAPAVLEGKSPSIVLAGKVDPMKVTETKRNVVVDLSDRKVYAYENGKLVRSFNASVGQGNNVQTGACAGDLCTPLGDFDVWLKYESQDMSGNLTLSDGTKESWDVKGVGFVNYFSRSGCAIHRIATSYAVNDANIPAMGNTSHGCVGIGWDVAPWFFEFAVEGTPVHVQQ